MFYDGKNGPNNVKMQKTGNETNKSKENYLLCTFERGGCYFIDNSVSCTYTYILDISLFILNETNVI